MAIRLLGVFCFVRGGAFLAYLSLALYHSKAPIYSIMLRIVTSLEQAWPASSIWIYMEANEDIKLLAAYMELGRSAIAVVAGLSRVGYNILRILK
jgi:hypothetical protein